MLNIDIFRTGYYLTEHNRINAIDYNVVIDPTDSAAFPASIKKKKKLKIFPSDRRMHRENVTTMIKTHNRNAVCDSALFHRADFDLRYIEKLPSKSMYQTSRKELAT